MKTIIISIILVLLLCACASLAEQKPEDPNKAIWEQHCETAKARVYNWLSRSHYSTTPWFIEGESLVYEKDNLVALRYHMAAVQGKKQAEERLPDLKKQQKATHIIQYSFKKHEWTLVSPVYGKTKPYRDRLPNKVIDSVKK